ncbi:hypothetical protein [Nannocystis punicea]|uniref:Uncharacterized protein n=1 Tax=Nannocystis punicea TaxID=2995304 RepID=A0ABY7H382_9BACT|nr:hypothetical protein [Nannocystis poenicansa]WAS93735.1 hypothetical protein O0S08_46980 [Nannocystis poenicansa]
MSLPDHPRIGQPPAEGDVVRRLLHAERSGALRTYELRLRGGTVTTTVGRPERKFAIRTQTTLVPATAAAHLDRQVAVLRAKGARLLADDAEFPVAADRRFKVLPGIEPEVASEVARNLRAHRRKFAMLDKLQWAAGDDWDLLMWSLVRAGRVQPHRDVELWMLLADAALEGDAITVMDLASRIASLAELYRGRGYDEFAEALPGCDAATERLLWSAYLDDRAHVNARALELSPALQRGLWLIRARAGDPVPEAIADELATWLRARPRPFTPLEAIDGDAFVRLDVPELLRRIDAVKCATLE